MNALVSVKPKEMQIFQTITVEDIFTNFNQNKNFAVLKKTLEVEVDKEIVTLSELDAKVEALAQGDKIEKISCPINLYTKNNHKNCATAYASKDNMSTYIKCKCPDCTNFKYYIIESRYGFLKNYVRFQKTHIMIEGKNNALFYKTYYNDDEAATISILNKSGVKDAWADRTVNIEIQKKGEPIMLTLNVVDIALEGAYKLVPAADSILDSQTLQKYGRSMKRYHNICFKPNRETSQEYNLWQGFPFEATHNYDVTPFLDFIYEAVGDEAEHILDFFAHMIQKPQEKPRYCLVFKGSKGVGKNTVEEALGRDLLYTQNYYRASQPEQFFSKFNFHIAQNLLSVMQELKWDNGKNYDSILKDMITETSRSVEQKFMDQVMFDNYSRIVITTNEKWAVPAKGKDERRYCVISFPDEKYSALDEKINTYHKWKDTNGDIAKKALMHFLKMRDLSQFDIDRAPETKGLIEQKAYSLTGVDKFVYNALHSGYFGNINAKYKSNSFDYLEVNKNRIKRVELYGCFQNCFPADANLTNATQFHQRMEELIGTIKIKSNGVYSQFLDIEQSICQRRS